MSADLIHQDALPETVPGLAFIGLPIFPLGTGSLYHSSMTATSSIIAVRGLEPEYSAYEAARGRSLRFWDDPAEDIYTFDDGKPV